MDETNQKKKMIMTGIIITTVIFAVILVLLIVLMAQEDKKTKFVFGGEEYKTQTVDMTAEDGSIYQQKSITYNNKQMPIMIITPDQKQYYSIESLAEIAGYKYNKGAYGELDESTNKCHIDNGGEYVTFSTESDAISKNIKTSDKYEGELVGKENLTYGLEEKEVEDEELFTLDSPVIKFADGKLYASKDAITKGLNMTVIENGNQISFYTLENLIETYSSFLSDKGYTLTSNFRNRRALYAGLAVVGKDGKYGVVKVESNSYEEVISAKYDTVEYVQSIGEFIISSASSYGMIAPGNEIPTIPLKYDNIQLLDAQEKLYIVELDEKYGVVDAKGNSIISTEYDQIGLSDIEVYKGQGIKSKYLIEDTCIPVMRNGQYGLFSKDGTELTKTTYSSIGCEEPSELIGDTAAMPTLIVPLSDEITCIVYSRNNGGITTYGMMTTEGTTVIEAYYTAIYYMTTNGKPTYYFNKVNNNELVRLDDLIRTKPLLKNLIENKASQNQNREDEVTTTDSNNQDIAEEALTNALLSISTEYYSNELEGPLTDYLISDNLVPLMEEYKNLEVQRDGEYKVIFEDDNAKYEAKIDENFQITEFNII